MTPPLETARLLLRPLELADATQAQVLFPHWEIVRYMAKQVPWPYPPDGAYTFYRDVALPVVGSDLLTAVAAMSGRSSSEALERRRLWR